MAYENAEFFTRALRAQGRPASTLDINPVTGRVGTPLDGANEEAADRNARVLRSRNGGMTTGANPQPKILGYDRVQREQDEYKNAHANDAFFAMARGKRQLDPLAGHETDEQFAANNAAERVPQVPVRRPVAPAPAAPIAGVPNDIQNNPVLALPVPKAPPGPAVPVQPRAVAGGVRPATPVVPPPVIAPPPPDASVVSADAQTRLNRLSTVLPALKNANDIINRPSGQTPVSAVAGNRTKKPADDDGEDQEPDQDEDDV